jgi:hypothetical protein
VELAGSLVALVDWFERRPGCESALLSSLQSTRSPPLIICRSSALRDVEWVRIHSGEPDCLRRKLSTCYLIARSAVGLSDETFSAQSFPLPRSRRWHCGDRRFFPPQWSKPRSLVGERVFCCPICGSSAHWSCVGIARRGCCSGFCGQGKRRSNRISEPAIQNRDLHVRGSSLARGIISDRQPGRRLC